MNEDLAGSAVVTVSRRPTTSDFYTRTINLVETAPVNMAHSTATGAASKLTPTPSRATPDEPAQEPEPTRARQSD